MDEQEDSGVHQRLPDFAPDAPATTWKNNAGARPFTLEDLLRGAKVMERLDRGEDDD